MFINGNQFGLIVSYLKENQGIKSKDIVEKLNIPTSTFYQYKNNGLQNIPHKIYKKLQEHFGVTPELVELLDKKTVLKSDNSKVLIDRLQAKLAYKRYRIEDLEKINGQLTSTLSVLSKSLQKAEEKIDSLMKELRALSNRND